MIGTRNIILALAFVLPVSVAACTQTPAPTAATVTPASVVSLVATQAAPTTPTAAAVMPTPGTAATPVATPGSVTIGSLNAKARAIDEYSFSYKVDAAGQTISSKAFVKGSMMRYDVSVSGAASTLLIDVAKKQALMLVPNEKTAVRIDYSRALLQTEQPSAGVIGLSDDVTPLRIETLDGKQAAVYEVKDAQSSTRYWLWVDTGLPLKAEVRAAQGLLVIEYTDYQFGGLQDSLFQLPPDTQVVDAPTVPGAVMTPMR